MLVKVNPSEVAILTLDASDHDAVKTVADAKHDISKRASRDKPRATLSAASAELIPLTLITKFQSIMIDGTTFTDLSVGNDNRLSVYTRAEGNLACSVYEMGEFTDGIISFINIMNYAANLKLPNRSLIYGYIFTIIEPLLYGTFKYVDSIDWIASVEAATEGEPCEACAITAATVAHNQDMFVVCTEQITRPIHIELGGETISPEVYPIVFVNNTFTFYSTIEYPHTKLYAADALFNPITTGYIGYAPGSLGVKLYMIDDDLVVARDSISDEQYAYDLYGRNDEVRVVKVHDPKDIWLKQYLSVVYKGVDHKIDL